MVARRAVALLLLAFCYSFVYMASASVPENALPDSPGDAPPPATITGVQRVQRACCFIACDRRAKALLRV